MVLATNVMQDAAYSAAKNFEMNCFPWPVKMTSRTAYGITKFFEATMATFSAIYFATEIACDSVEKKVCHHN